MKHGSFLDAARMPNKRGKAEEEEVVEEMERGITEKSKNDAGVEE